MTRLLIAAWIALAATVAHADPVINISPTPIGFGGNAQNNGGPIGVKQLGYFFVLNTGDAPLVISDVTITGSSAIVFNDACTTQTCTGPFTIAPGGNREFLVACTPAAGGYLNASLSMTHNATSGTSTAAMSCIGNHPPVIQVVPTSLDFGISHSCNVGDVCGPTCAAQPLTQSLTITNAAPDPSELNFHIAPALPSSTLFDEWAIVDNCTQTFPCILGPNQSHVVQYTFRPHGGQPQLYTTPLAITTNYPGVAPVSVPFYAEGGWGQLSFDTPSNLGTVAVGQTLTTSFTVRNTGRSCLTFTPPISDDPNIVVVGAQPPTIQLASGATHTFTLQCTPPDANGAAGSLSFDVSFENVDFVFRNVFCEAGTFARVVSPTTHAFGTIALPASPSQTFDLQNTGTLPLVVDAITGTGDFTVGNLPISTSIAAGTTHTFSINTSPTALGELAATITIGFDGAADLSIPVTALATDPVLAVSSFHVAHGDIDVDVGPHTATLTLQNTTSSPIAITSCAIAGDPELTIATACPFTIAGNTSAMLAVRFAPTAEAESNANITLTGTGFATGTIRLRASGTGLDQHVSLSAMSASFGDVVRRPLAPPTRTLTIENTATTPLVLSTFEISNGNFELVDPPTGLTLAPAATHTFTLRFVPTAYGDASGHFTIGNADDPAIARIALTGRGIERPVEVGPRTIDLGDVPVGVATRIGGDAIGLRNVSPTATITISKVDIDGNGVYSLVGPDRTTLAPNDLATLDVELVAPTAGEHTATIWIYLDNDPEPHAEITILAQAVPSSSGGGGGCCDGAPGDSRTIALVVIVGWMLLRRRRSLASSTASAR